ncbi:hypothetical protein SUBVAR_06867 [Subdoligranulum variabile DSM 15176]|uniref:Uncharacterized protein n=1 Tax=Subdoligranulum variabile DSM 15176 TaxID=411471 RepID=D1PR40_9FIRM|nr:hypothetical protein SUBVAR_06867 [Subdoligranulum variabile DSM 15176]
MSPAGVLAGQKVRLPSAIEAGRFFWHSSPHRQGLRPGPRRGSKGAAGFLGRAQIDGQAFFVYTEGEAMQRGRGL